MAKVRRFHATPKDVYGNVSIGDILNTEPVCQIYGNYHSDKVEVILNALNEHFGPVGTDFCVCGKEKAKEWLHCGCGGKKAEED